MKIAETPTTVTTLDVSVRAERNIYGGSPLRILAVVATTERGTYNAGTASEETRQAHREALERLGWGAAHETNTQAITRGVKTVLELDATQEQMV